MSEFKVADKQKYVDKKEYKNLKKEILENHLDGIAKELGFHSAITPMPEVNPKDVDAIKRGIHFYFVKGYRYDMQFIPGRIRIATSWTGHKFPYSKITLPKNEVVGGRYLLMFNQPLTRYIVILGSDVNSGHQSLHPASTNPA